MELKRALHPQLESCFDAEVLNGSADPVSAALDALRLLSSRRFELARVLSMTLRSVNELITETRSQSRRQQRIVCVSALRALRAAKKRSKEWDRPRSNLNDEAAFLLLCRVVDDLDRLIGCLLIADLDQPRDREDMKARIVAPLLSVLAAEEYTSR